MYFASTGQSCAKILCFSTERFSILAALKCLFRFQSFPFPGGGPVRLAQRRPWEGFTVGEIGDLQF